MTPGANWYGGAAMSNRGFRLLAGLGVAGGLAAGAAAQPPTHPGRAAVLLAPRPTPPGAGPTVARGAPNDQTWQTPPPNAGPARAGVMPGGRPVTPQQPRQVPTPIPAVAESQQPSLVSKGLAKLTGGSTARPPQQPTAAPAAAAQPQVFAGPPAWRWYGYGSVTPGANAFAPTGQYPRASANWYSVTGATPGAFPVPVVNPYRSAPGGEPPVYAQMPAGYRGPGVAGPTMAGPMAVPTTPRVAPPEPAHTAPQPPVRTAAVGIPTLAPPPGLGAELPVVPAKGPEPLAALPTAKPTDPEPPAAMPTMPVSVPAPVPPAPPSDDVRWQPVPAKPATPPATGNWLPAAGKAP